MDAIGAQFGPTTQTSAHQRHYHTRHVRVVDSCRLSDFCTMKSCRCLTVHVDERRAVAGAGAIGEQVASKRSEHATTVLVEVTILAVPFCCYTVCYYITNLMSGFLSTWVGLLSNRVGLLLNGVSLF